MTTQLSRPLVKPEAEVSKRILNLFLLTDKSSSLGGKGIQVLNHACGEAFAEMKSVAAEHPDIIYQVRCISFADCAEWHVGPEPVEIPDLVWKDLRAYGMTSTGAAVNLLAQNIRKSQMPHRGLPPVMVLISDGANTDEGAYDDAIEALDREPWGAKAIRLAIGIGDYFDRGQLEKFTNHPEVGVLEAKNAVDLVNYIRYATVTASIASSQSGSVSGDATTNVALPPPPSPATADENIKLAVV